MPLTTRPTLRARLRATLLTTSRATALVAADAPSHVASRTTALVAPRATALVASRATALVAADAADRMASDAADRMADGAADRMADGAAGRMADGAAGRMASGAAGRVAADAADRVADGAAGRVAGGPGVRRFRWLPAVLLVRPLLRAIDWAPLAVVTAFVAVLLTVVRAGETLPPADALLLMRVAGTLLGSAAAFALVDAMSADLGAAAVPRWVRQALRCLLAGGVAVVSWLVAFAYALSRLPGDALFPIGDLLIEMGVCLGIALAAAATAVRHSPGRQAAMAAVVVQLGLVLGTILLPEQVRLWPPTCGFGHWDEAHAFWLAMLPLPYAWLALANRDLRH